MIHIIIPVHNRLAATLRCIKSIQKQKIKKKLNIIIVDDGSSDGTSAYIAKNFSNIKILKGSGFMFWGGAVNFGIESVLKKKKPGDWVLLINNNVELKTETISSLISISENELPPVSSKYWLTYANSHFIVAPSYVKRSLLS